MFFYAGVMVSSGKCASVPAPTQSATWPCVSPSLRSLTIKHGCSALMERMILFKEAHPAAIDKTNKSVIKFNVFIIYRNLSVLHEFLDL